MKLLTNLLYIFFAFAIVACDPLADFRDDLDDGLEQDDDWFIYISDRILATEAEFGENSPYVLADEDYERSSNEAVAKYGNFSDSAPFEKYLPECISHLFGNPGELVTMEFVYYAGSSIDSTCFVTFVRETPADSSYWKVVPNFVLEETELTKATNKYTLIGSDYTMVGEGYPNFDLRYNTREQIMAKINTIIKSKFMLDLEEGQIWEVEFATYGQGEEVVESPMYFEVEIQ
ncbi:hypothetical protein [Carboxylicivirga linearis]|uniref:Lipoprotein n=1 Tax=Carboxylicivirga linearis TaxID=1628157 RepID=A0ABS5JYL5_9BACT|nr:hypothetical protein [Carboxylicivirga linearis]MBS2099951.1 hypothetical protein [Carboxylicivirga linearis]